MQVPGCLNLKAAAYDCVLLGRRGRFPGRGEEREIGRLRALDVSLEHGSTRALGRPLASIAVDAHPDDVLAGRLEVGLRNTLERPLHVVEPDGQRRVAARLALFHRALLVAAVPDPSARTQIP